jgi:hypothetical protein
MRGVGSEPADKRKIIGLPFPSSTATSSYKTFEYSLNSLSRRRSIYCVDAKIVLQRES